ncbi:MFS transporter [Pelagibius marinus]|uniref:MFS transporter n=1 Tax=Pelagibius marinus TaxID=2762760 RepID=UPI0018733DEA|nr:MFS transporter [Pelagibius marinus]
MTTTDAKSAAPQGFLARWRRPEVLLLLMAAAVPLSFATWQALINNFAYERAAFTGVEIGMMQSLREVPGFLAFGVVFLLLLIREQRLAMISLLLLGLGTAATGFFPSVLGIYVTTVVMSLGYHYYETLQISLSLQWIDKVRAPETLGRLISAGAVTSIVVYALVWFTSDLLALDYRWIYLIGGGATAAIALVAWLGFPQFEQPVEQHKHMVLRKRYWLYYALVFMSGARRQIFIVFAGFLMVEKFGYDVGAIALLFLLNSAINIWLAPKIGRLIGRIGERKALIFEYIGLIIVFTAYAVVENATVAAGLYVVDHLFFALAIAIKTYFQKIADPADIASTAGVSFTINHIAAVVIPAAFGFLWLASPAAVFLAGSAMAACSLIMALNVPRHPQPGQEVLLGRVPTTAPAPAE